jgi:outer membrane protein insertion porin family
LLAIPVGAAAEPIRVAILPMVIHAAGGESDYLSKGLAEMLSARLEQAGGIQVVRLQSNSRSTTQTSVAIEAGRAAKAEFVVFGSFTRFGEGASLDVRCARVDAAGGRGDAEASQVFVQSGQIGDIIPRLADLSGRVIHFVKGGAVAAAPAPTGVRGGASAGAASVGDLERRVEALERAVFQSRPEATGEPIAGEGEE